MNNWNGIKKIWTAWHWKRTECFTSSELALIKVLIPLNDQRREQLLSQAIDAPEVIRLLLGRYVFRASIPYVKKSEYLIEADRDYESPLINAVDIHSRRSLSFKLHLSRGGFLSFLEGAVTDGSEWPKNWEIDEPSICDESEKIGNWLPAIMTSAEKQQVVGLLADWVGLSPELAKTFNQEILEIRKPANDKEILDAEHRLNLELPREYKQFVQICNGLSINYSRPYDIYGTNELYSTVLSPGKTRLKYVVISNLYENGVVLMDCSNKDQSSVFVCRPNSEQLNLIGNLRDHLIESLMWLKEIDGESR